MKILICLLLSIAKSHTFPNLHLHMTPEELDHYFATEDHEQISDYEVTTLEQLRQPTFIKRGQGESDANFQRRYAFVAFGERFNLPLSRNDHILAPTAMVVRRSGDGESFESFGGRRSSCHYSLQSPDLIAAMSVCGDEARGMVFTQRHMIELHPLTSRLQQKVWQWQRENNLTSANGDEVLTFVKRHGLADAENVIQKRFNFQVGNLRKRNYKQQAKKFVEIGIFVDKEAYQKYSQFFKGDEKKLTEFIVCYMNGIDALYKLPSLQGALFSFSIVRLEFWSAQPPAVPLDGNREVLYEKFCAFQAAATVASDDDPRHWDLALLLSGLDFYDSQDHSFVTMGLSFVGGVCVPEYSCVIIELGTTEKGSARQYPSTGMGSVMVAGHEIAHNLGVSHDKDAAAGSRCDKNKFIMSPSRGTKDKSAWSPCSAEVLKAADSPCLNDSPKQSEHGIPTSPPGLTFGPRMQCVMFFLDDDAVVDNAESEMSEVCSSVRCKSEKRQGGSMRTGPALEGTPCGEGKWCSDGVCTDKPEFETKDQGGASSSGETSYWTEWSPPNCKSGCFAGSKGYSLTSRNCVKKVNGREVAADGCPGKRINFDFCDDASVCTSGRVDINEYGSKQCEIFSSYTAMIKKGGKAVRAAHNKKTLWPACAIYCTNAKEDGFYTPVVDVSNLPNIDPYYPDGTPCHEEGGEKFFCQRNMCLTESARVARSSADDFAFGDITAGNPLPESLYNYFKLDQNLAPLPGGSADVGAGDVDLEDDDELTTKKP